MKYVSPTIVHELAPRLLYCPTASLALTIADADPRFTVALTLDAFAAAYGKGAIVIVAAVTSADAEAAAARLAELQQAFPLPPLLVVTQLDADHLLPFRRIPVDEYVDIDMVRANLPGAIARAVHTHAREHLATFIERLDHGDALRASLATALRSPAFPKTIRGLATSVGVTARTLENQWRHAGGEHSRMRLEDLLWLFRLLRAFELRAEGKRLDFIANTLRVDLRSLQRASQRLLARPVGAVTRQTAAGDIVWLERVITHVLGVSSAPAAFGDGRSRSLLRKAALPATVRD